MSVIHTGTPSLHSSYPPLKVETGSAAQLFVGPSTLPHRNSSLLPHAGCIRAAIYGSNYSNTVLPPKNHPPINHTTQMVVNPPNHPPQTMGLPVDVQTRMHGQFWVHWVKNRR